VPSDDIDNSKIVENVHVHSEISSVMMIYQLTHVHQFLMRSLSSESTSDIVDALVESSTHIPDEIHIHEENQERQETKIESIVTTPSVSSSNESLEFLVTLCQVSSVFSSFSGCLKFSTEFF